MVTIRDVARKAGVSIAAVSYAMNGKEGVNEENRKKILKAAEELGYMPNQLARSLLKRKSGTIGLLISDFSLIYNMQFIVEIEKNLFSHNLQLMLACTANDAKKEKMLLDNFLSRNVDGLIVCPTAKTSSKALANLITSIKSRNIPGVMFYYPSTDYCDSIVPDLESGEYNLTRLFLEKGHHEIVFFSGPKEDYYSQVRCRGFRKAMKEAGIDCTERIIYCSSYGFADGQESMKEYLKCNALPHAFLAVNDVMAYGMLKELRKRDIVVPRDVSLGGFDHLGMPTLEEIELTTVAIPIDRMAEKCVQLLTEESHVFQGKTYTFGTKIVEGSTIRDRNCCR